MRAELSLGIAGHGQGGDRHDFAAPKVKDVARVEIAQWELDGHAGKVRRHFRDPAGQELLKAAWREDAGNIDTAAVPFA